MSETASSAAKHRRHERVESGISVRISTIEPERDPWTGRPFFRSLHETCRNVSRGGLFVKTTEPLDPGRRLLVEIRLPTGRPLEAIGRIAWVKRDPTAGPRDSNAGIGIEFLGGASEQFEALDDYITRRSGPSAGEDD
jgi:Tfp pilus assembly protein PilZ